MRDVGQHHAVADTSNEGGNGHDQGDDHDHDNEGGDHDASGISNPSDHALYGSSDPSGSTHPQQPDDGTLDLEDVPHVSPEKVDQPPPAPPQNFPDRVEGTDVVDHPSSSNHANHPPQLSSTNVDHATSIIFYYRISQHYFYFMRYFIALI